MVMEWGLRLFGKERVWSDMPMVGYWSGKWRFRDLWGIGVEG